VFGAARLSVFKDLFAARASSPSGGIFFANVLTGSVNDVIMILTELVNNNYEVSRLDNFLSLPLEKQNTVIDAALKCFGTNGYKKTSVSDIAAAAGISKALVFHYFGTKKALYLYLIDLSAHIIMKELDEKFDHAVTDFFDRIRLATSIEISVMKKHPAMLSFLDGAYFEKDDEVKEDIKTILENGEGEGMRNKIAFEGTDTSKFKDGVDPKLVMKILTLLAEGYLSKMPKEAIDIDALCEEFDQYIDLLKRNFYKEEYV
jgi:AcrR family transcriptional regulator